MVEKLMDFIDEKKEIQLIILEILGWSCFFKAQVSLIRSHILYQSGSNFPV